AIHAQPRTATPKPAPTIAAVKTPAAAERHAVQPVSTAPSLKDPVQVRVMEIISEKTGYPMDMLDLDLDLEADLGIDTVKQAEMFAAIRAAYNIARDDQLKLRDFPTLAHAIKFVYDRRPDLKPEAQAPAPAAPKTVPAPEVPAPAAATTVQDPVKEKVLQIITEKTGYPPDMLDLDLDLEADLGIDTVKQAEMFAAIRAAYEIPRDDQLKLRDFPTLAHTIKFVYDRRPDLRRPEPVLTAPAAIPVPSPAAPTPAAVPVSASGHTDDPVKAKVLEIIAEKTGYPPDMLDLDLDLEADLGIDTVKQAEMFAAIRAAYDIPRDDQLKLRDFPTLAHTIKFVHDRRPDLKPVTAPAAPAPAAEPVASAAAAPAAGVDPVRVKVLQIIAEKTGYPPDMLDLDLDLEADLGIDTVKQAEMFAAIRAAYDIPRDDQLKLRDFPTLAHTIQFVYDRKPELRRKKAASASAPTAGSTPAVKHAPATGLITGSMEAAAAIPRRVPVPYLRPKLDLCKLTGVVLNEQSRIVVICDEGGVGKALAGRLERLDADVLLIDDHPDSETLVKRIEEWKSDGPIQGIYWLPALDYEGGMGEMSLQSWREAVRVRVKLLYAAMRALYDQVHPRGTFLVSATRLGGLHGYDETGAHAPLGGAVSGFTKTYKREKSDALVKVLDFEPSRKTSALADILIDETLRDPGAVEIGYRDGLRWTIGLEQRPAGDGRPGVALGKDTVFLITGAAGSIVSAITADLAAASGGTFYLLDLAPAPDPANSDLQRFAADKENLKHDIFERLKQRGERVTPVMVEKEMAILERTHAALSAINAVKNAGGTAHYYSVNMLDREAVGRIMKEVAARSRRIDVLLHAAGLEISHLLPDKKPSEFDLVFDVKSDGWFNLISNLGEMPLGAAVVFSSIAGRFGNGGQTDYSSANDLLCKSISNFRTARPQTLGIAIDWTAWGGIGMASRGSIPTIMKQAGIDMLPPEAGIPIIRRELTAGTRGEVVIAGRLGIMLNEFDETGGLDVCPNSALSELLANRGIMTGRVTGMGLHNGLTIETELDPAQQPFLFDHQINGTPVLPGVMGIEGLAEIACMLFPARHLEAIEDVNFLAPFKFYRGQPRTLTLHADFHVEKEDVIAECRLLGSRILHGQSEPEITTHFKARVRLSAEAVKPPRREKAARPADGTNAAAKDIYRVYFHGPAYQVLESAWRADGGIVGLFAENLPPNHQPGERRALVSPRWIELCFQTASLLELAGSARMGLPYQIKKVTVFELADTTNGRLYSVVKPGSEGTFDAQVVDEKGTVYLALRGYRTMGLPDPIDPVLLKPIRDALA
ncbi:MAG TPA: SDR family NAD(P)-dependent oxidoreductase, partial [Acidobacteriota bacterium]|nr:SDR family NAD(P)-dependent oxidoreductase [Acidobacteriota bacterium]